MRGAEALAALCLIGCGRLSFDQVEDRSPPATMALGLYHSCIVREGGRVRCWGEGFSGQLGLASTLDVGDDEVPATASDVDVGGEVVALAAGWFHTCALLRGGAVRCWGDPDSAGNAVPRTFGDDEAPAIAGDVDLGGPALQIAANTHHTCALLEGGAVRCWGENPSGELGYPGSTATIGDDETPASAGDVDLGGPAVELALGGFHSCARMKSGRVRCWGANDGVLGYGTVDNVGDDETPASAGDLALPPGIVHLVGGGEHSCALFASGSVRCWGLGALGVLGYGNEATIGDDEGLEGLPEVDVGGRAVQLAAGESHTCALLASGDVRCWGVNSRGSLGQGNSLFIGDDERPSAIAPVPLDRRAIEIAAGSEHTCAVLDTGGVRCWGSNASGQLGYGHSADIGDDESVADLGDVLVE